MKKYIQSAWIALARFLENLGLRMLSQAEKNRSHDLNIVYSDRVHKQLLDIQQRTEAEDILEVLRRAIGLYDFATEAVTRNEKIFIHLTDGSIEELHLFGEECLDNEKK